MAHYYPYDVYSMLNGAVDDIPLEKRKAITSTMPFNFSIKSEKELQPIKRNSHIAKLTTFQQPKQFKIDSNKKTYRDVYLQHLRKHVSLSKKEVIPSNITKLLGIEDKITTTLRIENKNTTETIELKTDDDTSLKTKEDQAKLTEEETDLLQYPKSTLETLTDEIGTVYYAKKK